MAFMSTMKGTALLIAMDTGLVKPEHPFGKCDIAPFLNFWDSLTGLLKEASEEGYNVVEMLCGNSGSEPDHSAEEGQENFSQ